MVTAPAHCYRVQLPHSAVIVGDRSDPHVAAVVAQLPRHSRSATVFDATSLTDIEWRWCNGQFVVPSSSGLSPLEGRGWIRRLHVADWQAGTRIGSRPAAEATAWLQVLAAAIRTASVEWLTPLEEVIAAENKLVQDAAARHAQITVPRTKASATAPTGGDIIVKPLGPGYYVDEAGAAWSVPAVALPDAERAQPTGAPFIFQERLDAVRHLRVVTVADRAWCCSLDARAIRSTGGGTRMHTTAFKRPRTVMLNVPRCALRAQ